MDSIHIWAERCFRKRSRGASLLRSVENTELLESQEPLEEETLPRYKPKDFYPVHVGQVIRTRYRILGKLGWSAFGTVWFCRDEKLKRYVEIKVCTALKPSNGSGDCRSNNEWSAYSQLSGMTTDNRGASFLRQILDRFTLVSAASAEHQCFVYSPAGLNLEEFQKLAPNADMNLLKDIVKAMLQAIDFLHSEAHIMHADVKLENILFTVSNKGTQELFARRLQGRQPIGKRDPAGDRVTYRSVKFTDLLELDELSLGKPVLADLGSMRILRNDDELLLPKAVTAEQSRSPEMLLNMSWSCAVDIWSFAVITWLILAKRPLFNASEAGRWSTSKHLAQIVGLLGAPPPDMVRGKQFNRSPGDESGSSGLNVDDKFGDLDWEQRTDLLDFMRSMLKWRPEERKTAKELLGHAFLKEKSSGYE